MGIYRINGTFKDFPLYKQDGGEHYIYFDGSAWKIGARIGHSYGWLMSKEQTNLDCNLGWEYLLDNGEWSSKDKTLTVEPIKGNY